MKPIYFIAKRYLFAKSGNNAINVIIKVASFGVMIVAAAFIIVLSGFSGIKTFNLDLIKLTSSDIKITPKKGKSFIFDTKIKQILNKDIIKYSKILEEKVFVIYNDKQKIAKIKGVDTNYFHVIPMDSAIFMGHLPTPNTNELLLGVSLANEFSFMLSGNNIETINLMVPKPGKGFITDSRKAFSNKYFIPTGIYQTTSDHDNTYLFADLGAAQQLLQYEPNQITSIEIKIKDPEQLLKTEKYLQKKLGKTFYIKNRKQQNKLIYKMLNTENLMVYFVFALILILALFNIIGTIMMILIDKKENIHSLRVLGLNFTEIKKIFITQGFFMTFLSGTIGLIFGLILIYIQQTIPFLYIPQTNMPYPVEIHFYNILYVLLTIFIMGGISTYIAVYNLKK